MTDKRSCPALVTGEIMIRAVMIEVKILSAECGSNNLTLVCIGPGAYGEK